MTKKTPKPTAQHLQKLADLMDTRPEGISVQQVQNALTISPTLAKAALVEIGAVEQDGKWVFVEPVTIAESAPVELVTIEPEPVTIDVAQVDWSAAPEGATYYAAAEGIFYPCFYKDDFKQVWVCDGESEQWHPNRPSFAKNRVLIPRPSPLCTTCETKTDIAPLSLTGECQQCYEDAVDKAWWDTQGGMFEPVEPKPATKSDFAVALESERQRVLEAVALGGTVERLAERTGLHVDDVQMHLDVLIDDGAIVERPIIVAMSYRVAV